MSDYYRKNYNFFCATNWSPIQNPGFIRTVEKRQKYIELIEKKNLNCISLIDPSAKVSRHSKIGKGVFIDSFCYVNSNVKISDWSIVYGFSTVADSCTIGRNCVLQRKTLITGEVTLEDNVFMAIGSIVNKNHVTIANNTFIQQGIMVLRDTKPYELIGLAGKDLRRVYKILTEE
jgi:UDP-3-O-[3-hydroxymyristoyl] glucosamine N-acyltransferase